jgi:hypothetical protein
MQGSKKANKATLRSEWRSVLKKSLTEPTLLEMSGNPTYQDLADQPRSGLPRCRTGVLLPRQSQFSADRRAPGPGKQSRNPSSITRCLSARIGVVLN